MASHEDLGALARRIGLIGLLMLLGGLSVALLQGTIFPQSAGAQKCITCEIEEPGEEVEAQILTIEIAGQGAVKNGTKTYCENTGLSPKTCEVELAEGKKVTLSAAPLGEYVFQSWSGACSGSGSCEVTMTEAKSVQATFHNPPPTVPTISSPTNGQVFEWTAEESISVSFTDSDPTIVGFRCSVDLGSSVSCASPWTTPKLSPGEHKVTVSALDGGGNLSSQSQPFKVVVSPPSNEEGGGEPPKEEGGSGSGGGTPVVAQPPSMITQTTSSGSRIDVKLVAKTRSVGRATVFRKLMLKRVPEGPFALASCKGGGCPFSHKKIHVNSGVADLSAFFADRELGPGTVIQLSAGGPERTTETITLRIRVGKAPRVTKSWRTSPVT